MVLREARHRFFGKTALYEMPADSWEIDDPVDIEIDRCSGPADKPIIGPPLPTELDAACFRLRRSLYRQPRHRAGGRPEAVVAAGETAGESSV